MLWPFVCVCVCVWERERKRERERGGGGERETVNENWCEDTGRMYRVKSRNHKYMNRSKDVGRVIACISSIAVATFMVLPQENVEGRLVPVLFKERPTLYRIFLISALCAFLGSMGSMLIQHKPRVEYFCRVIGVAFMLSALVIVLYATALWFVVIPLPSSM